MKYLKNLLDHGLALIDNRVTVAAGDVVTLSDQEAEHDDVAFAIRRNWASVSDTPQEKTVYVKEALVFGEAELLGSEFPPGKGPEPEPVIDQPTVLKSKKVKEAKEVTPVVTEEVPVAPTE